VAVAQRLSCTVEEVVAHGDRVYTVSLRPERPVPRFRAGQFLHLAIDPYDPAGFWPESRVFSIASPSTERDALRITYAVHGPFTKRMEQALHEGAEVWVKLPYGDFVIEGSDVVLVAGGTGMTAFSAFLESVPAASAPPIALAYGARHGALLIYRELVERCVGRLPSFRVAYFVEHGSVPASDGERVSWSAGRVSVDAFWPRIDRPHASTFFLSGPPPMIHAIEQDLRARHVPAEAIRIDAWE
jgi:ferredoxin-NADP reductase